MKPRLPSPLKGVSAEKPAVTQHRSVLPLPISLRSPPSLPPSEQTRSSLQMESDGGAILGMFVDMQATAIRNYISIEVARSRRRYMRRHTPWYIALSPRWIRRRYKEKLSMQLCEAVFNANDILQGHLEFTRGCLMDGDVKSIQVWRDRTDQACEHLSKLELSYAPSLMWNILWALDMLSENPVLRQQGMKDLFA